MLSSAPKAPSQAMSRDELIREGLPWVRRIAFRMARRLPPSVDVGDLIGAGSEGLIKAADAFDPSRHPRFRTYAEARIRGSILDELRSQDPMTRHGRRRLAEVTRAIRSLTLELGRPPEEAEVAKKLEIDIEEYRRLSADFAKAPALARTAEVDPDRVGGTSDVHNIAVKREQKRMLAEAIRRLPERTQRVLALYYQKQCTQAEIGAILGVTEGRVCQILGEATVRIRAELGLPAPEKRKRIKRAS
ncbi:MAG: FliA/WhiG family RNA polymerase sigma factor [Myxococcota bacterium]